MSISLINENAWIDIVNIQDKAYAGILPEDAHVLKSKWLSSPNTCAVYLDDSNRISAYLLAHPWSGETPPKLNQVTVVTGNEYLYLHDLALAEQARGKGIAKKLVENLINTAKTQGFKKILLVSVQHSGGFWRQFGFLQLPTAAICSSYGDGAKLMVLGLEA
jgi:ribosomal protein S18 acetylase RimI-like enzyme